MIKQVLTGKDNATYDIARVLAAIAFLVGVSLQIYATLYQVVFDLTAYGTGVAVMLGGLGFTLKIKESTEPNDKA